MEIVLFSSVDLGKGLSVDLEDRIIPNPPGPRGAVMILPSIVPVNFNTGFVSKCDRGGEPGVPFQNIIHQPEDAGFAKRSEHICCCTAPGTC